MSAILIGSLLLGQIQVKPGMTIKEFGRLNPGDYSVTQDYRTFPKLEKSSANSMGAFSGSLFIYDLKNRHSGYKHLHVKNGIIVGKDQKIGSVLANLPITAEVRMCRQEDRILLVQLPKQAEKLQHFTGFLTKSKLGPLYTACFYFKDGLAIKSRP